MTEPLIVTTLRAKAQSLESYIATCEDQLVRARADLAHVLAVLGMYALEDPQNVPQSFNMRYLYKHGEVTRLVLAGLAAGPKTSRQLAVFAIGQKDGLDAGDEHLVREMTHRIATGMSKLVLRKVVVRDGTVPNGAGRAAVWKLAE